MGRGGVTYCGYAREVAQADFKEMFFSAAGICLVIAMFQAWNDENERADKSSEDNKTLITQNGALRQKNTDLTNQLIAKERPIILQPTSSKEIEVLLRRQDQELAKLKNSLPSPKKRALQVSNDLLKFLAERRQAEPQMPMASRASTQEEYVKQQDAFQTTYRQWMNATAAECQAKFAIPLAEVMDDMHAEKLDPGPFCNLFNGNLFAVQECATSIGVLAQKLSR